ncbi:ATP-binding protein [Anaerosalibacter sp. Marseille-P3206]|uniref:ATP-binding protein n=1 Tax=Anaerosalibacter sp. Marseille-P3206 TaxID=1871005 RepID=UPI0009849733|nr:ATP-binding protein [Anaerosalibacter sp. Marseille-P3206]
MHIQLMPSQKEYLNRILELENKNYRRENILLFGASQTGKTELARYLSKENPRYIYKNFTKEYLEGFVSTKRLRTIEFPDLQLFLRKIFIENEKNNEIVILDEIDSVISVITENDKHKLISLYKQFLTMDQPIKYIFLTSIFDQNMIEKLIAQFSERVLAMPFCREDKEFIVKTYFNNINLFELDKVTSLRQMFN